MSRELRYERVIQASPTRVFDLFTSPVGQREFYGNDARRAGLSTRAASCASAALGRLPSARRRTSSTGTDTCSRRSSVPAACCWHHRDPLDGSTLAFSTEFTFAPRDGATLLTMIQWGFPSDELREEHAPGVPHAFDRPERAL